jgi:NADPH-dependent ferric siderophore reductase
MSQTDTPEAPVADPRQPQRVRHGTSRRVLTVKSANRLTPNMIRVTLAGDELAGFTSLGFDDHLKLFVPASGTNGAKPEIVGRNYTPRRYDAEAGELVIDFALHEAGPATRWAEQATAGQAVAIGGPRASFIIPLTYDWHLLAGDDTALPAIARRLEELPAGTRAVVIVEVEAQADEIPLPTRADAAIHWIHRKGAPAGQAEHLSRALRAVDLPAGDYYAWVACEGAVAKALRNQLLDEHGAKPKWTRAAAYWRHGVADVHENLKDEDE